MGKKVVNIILFLAVLAAAVGITIYTGNGLTGSTIYNFVFLGIMALIYLIGMFAGMFRMNNIAEAFSNATEELNSIFKSSGKVATEKLTHLRGIFLHKYLDSKMEGFVESIEKIFETKKLVYYGNRRVNKIASFCGSGGSQAVKCCDFNEVDTVITSDLAHHHLKELVEKD